MHYAGIGSRRTPPDVLARMTATATALDLCGYTLRSGGAVGADTAFERGVLSGRKEIFLPWPFFNTHASQLHLSNPRLYITQAMELAAAHHPAWNRCDFRARSFHARNCFQVLGARLDDPVAFVICWTPRGELVGGTALAIRIAHAYGVPVHNWGAE